MARLALFAAVAVALVAVGCGGGSSPDAEQLSTAPAAGPRPALCTSLRARVTGHVATSAATERALAKGGRRARRRNGSR